MIPLYHEETSVKFEEALIKLKQGNNVKLPDQNYYLSMIGKIYYDGDTCRPVEILSIDNILRDDWEVYDD
jgi:hypothetical protein